MFLILVLLLGEILLLSSPLLLFLIFSAKLAPIAEWGFSFIAGEQGPPLLCMGLSLRWLTLWSVVYTHGLQ